MSIHVCLSCMYEVYMSKNFWFSCQWQTNSWLHLPCQSHQAAWTVPASHRSDFAFATSAWLSLAPSSLLSLKVLKFDLCVCVCFVCVHVSICMCLCVCTSTNACVCENVCVCECVHALMSVCAHVFECACICVYACLSVYKCVWVWMSVWVYVCAWVCVAYMCVSECVYVCLCMWVCVFVCERDTIHLSVVYMGMLYIHMGVHICASVSMYVCVDECMFLCMCTHAQVCVFVHVSVCVCEREYIWMKYMWVWYMHTHVCGSVCLCNVCSSQKTMMNGCLFCHSST